MRAVFFHKIGERSATYRYRLALYLPYLRSHGIECAVSTLEDGPLQRWSLLKRAALGEFDLAVVFHELFPHIPGGIERRLLKIPYLYDFDDAIHTLETPFTRGKTAELISGASVAIAGSGELAKYASLHNRDVRLIPTVVDLARYAEVASGGRTRKPGTPFTIGWIGTPETAHYLKLVAEPLRKLQVTRGARIVVVGSGPITLSGVKLELKEWRQGTELQELASFDAGIMPLANDEWSRGKCGFKLVQYLASGIPQVASPVGANSQLVADGETGLLARTPQEWTLGLQRLADDPALRSKLGAASLERARAHFCLDRTAPLFRQALLDALPHPSKRLLTS